MNGKTLAPYGAWRSPITASDIAQGNLQFSGARLHNGDLYWCEMRAAEGGRQVVVRRTADGMLTDMTPSGFNARTRVHEYGGGAHLPYGDTVVFANFADQRVYVSTPGQPPRPLTTLDNVRFADFAPDPGRDSIVAVMEDHRSGGEPINTIVRLAAAAKATDPEVLVAGNDFYGAPRVSPDGSRLAWLTWNHPDMPWDAAQLWVAPIKAGGGVDSSLARRVAGGAREACVQPAWSPDSELYFISDRTNWWNLYRWRGGRVEPVTTIAAEFTPPYWQFGLSSYAFIDRTRIAAAYTANGGWTLALLDLRSLELTPIDLPYQDISSVSADANVIAFIGGAGNRPATVCTLDLHTGRIEKHRRASNLAIDPAYFALPSALEFPTAGNRTAYGLFYAPRNPEYAAPADTKPPLVVMVHGGPTAAASTTLQLKIQYYTSRGIAVLDVNYGGSTGYGREYRERLHGQWGVVDVDDCCQGAAYLAAQGLVDGNRLAIRGGSAGGYTTLAALTFRDVFAAGASHYGVSDCETLAAETHKFEARYLDRLIGPFPEKRDLYRQRSPIHHTERLTAPVAFFQGTEDEIVPPNQARLMAAALRRKGLPVAYVEFEGEQHGFRQAANVQRALEGELYFFARIFGFDLADPVEPLPIENL